MVKKKDRDKKKKEYLKKKATQPVVLSSKEREKKRKQRKKVAGLVKKTTKLQDSNKVSPQILGKALGREKKHLPKCPLKQLQVLAKMVQDLSPENQRQW